jgi:hypothetical protein
MNVPMPRLTNQLYLARHHDLKQAWTKVPQLFDVLAPHQLWDLHEYHKFTQELTDPALLDHRQQVTIAYPSLAHSAGKHYLRLYHCYQLAQHRSKGNPAVFDAILDRMSRQPKVVGETRGRAGPIVITARFRPEPDYGKLARAFLLMVEDTNQTE